MQLTSFLEAWLWLFSGDVVLAQGQLLTVKDCYAAITMSSFSKEEYKLSIVPSTLGGMNAALPSCFGIAVSAVVLVLATAMLSLAALLLLILRRHRKRDGTK